MVAELTAFAGLLFITRFVARGHLVLQTDQECHIGGIAVDLLKHGVRFPLLVYAPNEYDNGSFFSGLLAAVSFSLLGRNVLALKLTTHVISAAGAVATLWLLRGCLEELGLMSRTARLAATGALVVAIAAAPRVVTVCAMYAVGNHAEGAAIDTVLLASFAWRLQTRSAVRTAAFWLLVGLALYVNKGTVLVIPVLAAAETALAFRARWLLLRQVAAMCGGFALGMLPEVLVIVQRHGAGWATMVSKGQRNAQTFPHAFVANLLILGEYRIELLTAWAVAIALGTGLFLQRARRFQRGVVSSTPDTCAAGVAPVTLGLVVSVPWLLVAALIVMAQNSLIPSYVTYGYPAVIVLFSVLVALICTHATSRWGHRAGAMVGVAAIAVTLILHRPDALTWGSATVSALWRNRAGAACSWRFAEGFERQYDHGLVGRGTTREQYAIEQCRSLSERDQVLDCIGGVARELNWRQQGRVQDEPPAGLTAAERHAYAYLYGTHRRGDMSACSDFANPDLRADCTAAVQLECLVFGDIYSRFLTGHAAGQPRCTIAESPMGGFWAEMRADLLRRTAGSGPQLADLPESEGFGACKSVFDACY